MNIIPWELRRMRRFRRDFLQPGSSTFELVKTLSENGYLWADENKRYMLGARLIQLGAYASSYLDLNKIAAQPLKDKVGS